MPWPNSGALTLSGDYVWVRFVHDASTGQVTTWTSTNGTTFASFGAPISVAQYLNQPGGFRIGLFAKHDGSGNDTVQFDAFNVVPASANPQTPGDDCGGGSTGDTTPPQTTNTLDPASPDGSGGWYKSPVKVTLAATDSTTARASTTPSTGSPAPRRGRATARRSRSVTTARYTVEYRSVDEAGNTEATRSVTFKIDKAAPTTTAKLNGAAPAENYDGPVAVDLDATDATSGVKLTEIRVDGGEWKPYVEEETILNSAADLAKWAQAGPGGLNWVDQDGGFARTSGGLGMPWYPVKDYGDFSLKLQWRDSSTGNAGNGGVFVRFPNPEEAVARPAAQRYPVPGRLGDERARVGRDLLRPRAADQRQPGLRAAEDGLRLQLLAAQRDAGEGAAAGDLGRLRDPRGRPDVHADPQRRDAAGVREHPGQAVLARG